MIGTFLAGQLQNTLCKEFSYLNSESQLSPQSVTVFSA